MTNKKPHVNWLFLIIAGVGWGGSVSLTKIAAASGYHPLTLLFWQLVISIAILLTWLAANHIRLPLSPAHLWFYVMAGILGTALPDGLAYFIAPHLPAGIIAIVYALVPMLTFALAVLFGCEKFEVLRFIGVGLGLMAILLLITPNFNLQTTASPVWILLLVLAGSCYAAESIFAIFFMPANDSPLTLLTGMTIAALSIITPVMLATGIPFAVQNFLGKAEMALIASSFIHVACYATYLHLLRRTGAIFSSQVAYVVTLSGVLWGILIFSETHDFWTWTSLIMAITGLTLVRQRQES
ncbi:MAG TPA: DMT family transporter [Rhizobiales bacterium]|nr:DMT family transporter [Hyphomicrobiales bacterium]